MRRNLLICIFLILLTLNCFFYLAFASTLEDACGSGTLEYWIDPDTGSDMNDGGINAPFASISRLEIIPCQVVKNFTYLVHLSPSEHLVSIFQFHSTNNWHFQTCTICPNGKTPTSLANLVLVPPASHSYLGIFSNKLGSTNNDLKYHDTEFNTINSHQSSESDVFEETSDSSSSNDSIISESPETQLLSLSNLIIRPKLECYTELGRLENPSFCIFNLSIFRAVFSSISLSSVIIENLHLQSDSTQSIPVSAAIVSVLQKGSISFYNCIFRNNSVSDISEPDSDNARVPIDPLFGSSGLRHSMKIENTTFQFNYISAPFIRGGLINCRSETIITRSSFISTSGYITNYGMGLVISASSLCNLSIEESLFEDNQFKVVPRIWDADFSAAEPKAFGVTAGGAVGGDAYCLNSVKILSTRFIRNVATQGAAVAIIYPYVSNCFIAVSDLTQLTLHNSTFERNNATSGLAAAILVQGPSFARVSISDLIFDNNLQPYGIARRVYPGRDPESSDLIHSSLCFLADLQNANLSLENIRIISSEDQREETDQYVIRISISSTFQLSISNLAFENLQPAPTVFPGGLLQVQEIRKQITVENVKIDFLDDFGFIESQQAITLCIFDEFESDVLLILSNMSVSMPHSSESRRDVTVLSVRGASNAFLEKIFVDGILESMAPLILINEVSTVELYELRISRFSGPIQVVGGMRFKGINLLVSDYRSSFPMFVLESVAGTCSFDKSSFSHSSGSFIRIMNSDTLFVTASSFSFSDIGSLDGAISMENGRFLHLHHSQFFNLSSIHGSAITTSRTEYIVMDNTSFVNNVATTGDGGSIWAPDCSIFRFSNLHFKNTHSPQGNGGAIYSTCQTIRASSSTFEQCYAGKSGGSLFHTPGNFSWDNDALSDSGMMLNKQEPDTQLTMQSSSFEECSATQSGGSIFTKVLSMKLASTKFKESNAQLLGGAIRAHIGVFGVTSQHHTRILNISDCSFYRNSAPKDGQPMTLGGAISIEADNYPFTKPFLNKGQSNENGDNDSKGADRDLDNRSLADQAESRWNVSFSKNEFFGNSASFGGAISSSGLPLNLFDLNSANSFESNSALTGGACFFSQIPVYPTFVGQKFYNNFAHIAGGAVATDSGLAPNGAEWLEKFKSDNNFSFRSYEHSLWGPYASNAHLKFSLLRQLGSIDDPTLQFQVGSTSPKKEDIFKSVFNTQIAEKRESEPQAIDFGTIYPGISKTFILELGDSLGQKMPFTTAWLAASLQKCLYKDRPTDRVQFSYTLTQATESFENFTAGYITLSVLVSLKSDANQPEAGAIDAPIFCEFLWNVPDPRLAEQLHIAPNPLPFVIMPCGFGTGQQFNSSNCQICPLGSYSFHGECLSCLHDPHVTCFAGTIQPLRNYWVSVQRSSSKFQSLRCPPGFCEGVANSNTSPWSSDSEKSPASPTSFSSFISFSEEALPDTVNSRNDFESDLSSCAQGRTGIMCGKCLPGLHESVLSTCLKCSKPNWFMITLILIGLGFAVLILHTLVAASSGKATILIFFVQTCFIINYQISVSEVFRGGSASSKSPLPDWISFILCPLPLNALSRTLILGLVPHIMAVMISAMFGVRHMVVVFLARFYRSSPNSEYQSIPTADSDDQSEDGNLIIPYSDMEEDEGSAVHLETDDCDADEKSDIDPSDRLLDKDNICEKDESSWILASRLRVDDAINMEAMKQWRLEMGFWHWKRLVRTLSSLLASSFSSVLGIAISTMDCVSLVEGTRVLHSAPGISCTSSQFKLFRSLNGLWVPYLILVAGFILWKLIKGYKSRTLSALDVRWGVWYEMYKAPFFAWKLVEMLRRLTLSLLAKALLSTPSLRAAVLFALCIAFLATHLLTWPYRQKLENQLETLSLSMLALIALLNVWNAHLFSIARPSRVTFVLVWVICIIVAAFIVLAIGFAKIKSTASSKKKRSSKLK